MMESSRDEVIKQKYLRYKKRLKYCMYKHLNSEATVLNIDSYLLFGRIFWEILELTYKYEPTTQCSECEA